MSFLPEDFAWSCLFLAKLNEIYNTLPGESVGMTLLIHLSESWSAR